VSGAGLRAVRHVFCTDSVEGGSWHEHDVERGDLDRMRKRAEEVVVLAERLGFPLYLGLGRLLRGFARVESGEGEAGIVEIRQAMGELAGIGTGGGAPQILAKLAESLGKVGRHDEALGALALGVACAEQQGQHYYDAELHRLRAKILLEMDGNAVEEAEALFHAARLVSARRRRDGAGSRAPRRRRRRPGRARWQRCCTETLLASCRRSARCPGSQFAGSIRWHPAGAFRDPPRSATARSLAPHG
jgi:predicted ATPase